MNKKLSFVILLACTFYAGQFTLTAQCTSDQSSFTSTEEGCSTQQFPSDNGEQSTSNGDESTSSTQPFPAVHNAHQRQLGNVGNNKMSMEEAVENAVPESTRIVGPLKTRSDFEKFVEDEAGHPLPVYGRQMFDEESSTFAPMDHIPVPSDYAIGPDDELLVRVWGQIDLDISVTVDRNGQISLPQVGTLSVAGLRYDQLEGYLRSAVGRIYKNFDLNVTLGQLRSIQIYVLGSARQPGAYTVGSLSTLLDALFVSGGPSATGTMRRIQLRRGGRTITELDLYDVLQKGDKSHDVQLLPGDVIYIPPVGPQVAIIENVNEPGIYELKGEATIASVLDMAGGLTSLARVDRVLLESIANHKDRRVDEFTLDATGMQRILKDADLIRILPISPEIVNSVTLRGNVAVPGRYVWHEGMRVTDLIPSRDFLITSGHWIEENHQAEKQQHPEVTAEQPTELKGEQTTEQTEEQPTEPTRGQRAAGQRAEGQRKEGTEEQPTKLKEQKPFDLMADLDQTDAEIDWDYASIERLDKHDLSTRLITFNLGNAIDSPMSPDNQFLKAGDVITIFSRKDIPLPLEQHSTIVQVGGEVNKPGVYRINPGDTLRDLVERAGGLTPHSYLYGLELTRASTRKLEEEQLQMSISRLQKDLLAHYANATNMQTSQTTNGNGNGMVSDQQAQLQMQQELIEKLSAVEPTGRVVLNIKHDAKTEADLPDFNLEDGDTVLVPTTLDTIQVVGEVYNESAFRYQVNKRLGAYLHDAGGGTRMADAKRTFLIRADGTVISEQAHSRPWEAKFEDIALMPGDTIVVPPKIKSPGGILESLPMITQIVSQTAITGAVLSLVK